MKQPVKAPAPEQSTPVAEVPAPVSESKAPAPAPVIPSNAKQVITLADGTVRVDL